MPCTANMGFRNPLQPYRLPDTRYRGVPDTVRLIHLLAVRLRALIGRVPYGDQYLLLIPFFQKGGYGK
ncbi:hypothetical protein FQZ97_876000 [compost metagenome]